MTQIHTDYQIRKWSVQVRYRDRVCQICGSKERLEAHHIRDKSTYPEDAIDLDNGVALCGGDTKTGHHCHKTFHILFKGSYGQSCTRLDFMRFKSMIEWAREIRVHIYSEVIKL